MTASAPTLVGGRPWGSLSAFRSFATRRGVLWAVSFVLFFGGWDVYVRLSGIEEFFLPSPALVIGKMLSLLSTYEFRYDIYITSVEFVLGFALALVVGVPVGLLAGWYPRVFYALNPFLTTLYAMPRVALLPWIMLIAGLDLGPKIIMVFLGVVLPVTLNTLYGVRTVDARLVSMAHSFGARDLFVFRTLVLPGVVPFVASGVRIGVGTGLIGVIIAEFLVARAGVGHLMHFAGHNLETPVVFVCILVIAMGAMLVWSAAIRVESYFQRWRAEP